MPAISASQIVSVVPSVLSASGTSLALNGLFLSSNTRIPTGTVIAFPTQTAVDAFFGASADESLAANNYLLGFDNSSIKPGNIMFAQYNTVAVAAYLRGGSLAAMTLAQLKALTGTVIVAIDGVTNTSASIVLTAATSFSNAATIIQAAFTTPNFTVSFDSVSGAFVFTSNTTGATSTSAFATGTVSTSLKLTSAAGATLSQGAAANTDPATFMNLVKAQTTNWATLVTIFNPDVSGNANKLLFANWINTQGERFVYSCWDTDATYATTVPATTSLAYILNQANTSGTTVIYTPTYAKAAALAGMIASVNFNERNGRTNFKFRSQAGLTADVTDDTAAANITANFANYYGIWKENDNQFIGFAEGQISGRYKWIDSYINQIAMASDFRLAYLNLFFSTKNVGYDPAGDALKRSALIDPVQKYLNFGAFAPGVVLSASQKANVNAAAGMDISAVLFSDGCYHQVVPAAPSQRQNRTATSDKFWFTDQGGVNHISLNSIAIQ